MFCNAGVKEEQKMTVLWLVGKAYGFPQRVRVWSPQKPADTTEKVYFKHLARTINTWKCGQLFHFVYIKFGTVCPSNNKIL